MGQVFFVQLDVFSAKVCMKIDLYNDRKVTVDDDNTDCSPEGFNESATYEIYEYHQTDTIHYRKSSSSEWKGQISFGEDETVIEAPFDINYYNAGMSVFKSNLIVPSCYKPSVMPSNPPTPAPSQCAIDEVIGKTYIFPSILPPDNRFCVKLQMFVGGTLSVDRQNADCANEFPEDATVFSYYSGPNLLDSEVIFDGGPQGLSGTVSSTQRMFVDEQCKVDYHPESETFAISMEVESCILPYSSPSMSPRPTLIP